MGKKTTKTQLPAWVSMLLDEGRKTLISTARSNIVDPLAERVARAMSVADGETWSKLSATDKQTWKNRAMAALAELARNPTK